MIVVGNVIILICVLHYIIATIRVYENKIEALTKLKQYKEGRLNVFKNRDDAINFACSGFVENQSFNSSSTVNKCKFLQLI